MARLTLGDQVSIVSTGEKGTIVGESNGLYDVGVVIVLPYRPLDGRRNDASDGARITRRPPLFRRSTFLRECVTYHDGNTTLSPETLQEYYSTIFQIS